MRARLICFLSVCLFLISSCADKKVRVADSVAPDGLVTAVYEKLYWGGAAGGTSHCVSLIRNSDGKEERCVLVGSSACVTGLSWMGDELIVTFYGGEFFENKRQSKFSMKYRSRAERLEDGRACMSEWR